MQLAFPVTVSTGLISLGVVWACAIGLIGGLIPALRSVRVPVAVALRTR
jgi:putative ABC transport system permease protein